jgi:hypothetical protein
MIVNSLLETDKSHLQFDRSHKRNCGTSKVIDEAPNILSSKKCEKVLNDLQITKPTAN